MKSLSITWTLACVAFSVVVFPGNVGSAEVASAENSEDASLVQPGAKLIKLASEFKFTEGPVADDNGNVYFTDQPNDRIMKWSLAGELSVFKKPCGRSNGLAMRDGKILACADENNQLWLIAMDGTHEVLLSDYEGKRFNGPNDLWVRPDGGIYFTDPLYVRPYWNYDGPRQDSRSVYFLSANRKQLTPVDGQLKQPNGIIGTSDGTRLYVSDINDRKTYSYSINQDGSLTDRKLFCAMGSDGMTIDSAGNVYLTGKGVTIFSPDGEKLQNIPVPEGWTANVCFGGEEFRTLFITASGSLYSIRMQTSAAGK